MAQRYELVRTEATAAEFHARQVPDPALPALWWHDVSGPALVLGSTQRDDVVDVAACRALGVDVVRRRSGGGAVLLEPGAVAWVDVILPRDGDGWSDDVHGPMVWLGGHLAASFTEVLGADAPLAVHDGALRATEWSRLVCFDGLGPGEVTLGGSKLVGISQRRTRGWARLQCAWYVRNDPADLARLLAPGVRPPAGALAVPATVPASIAAAVPEVLRRRLSGDTGVSSGLIGGELGENG